MYKVVESVTIDCVSTQETLYLESQDIYIVPQSDVDKFVESYPDRRFLSTEEVDSLLREHRTADEVAFLFKVKAVFVGAVVHRLQPKFIYLPECDCPECLAAARRLEAQHAG